jgi:hypothetical protein
MGKPSDLNALLRNLIAPFNGTVYFQPPENIKMTYPCIRCELSDIKTEFADNKPYSHKKQYSLTTIEYDPDSGLVDAVSDLPMCSYDRPFIADGLYHNIFTIYF